MTYDLSRIRVGPTRALRLLVGPSSWWQHRYGRAVCTQTAGAWTRRTT